ncbi:MAG: hypothetical protein U0894_13380 [Pirellulales bacterium]
MSRFLKKACAAIRMNQRFCGRADTPILKRGTATVRPPTAFLKFEE